MNVTLEGVLTLQKSSFWTSISMIHLWHWNKKELTVHGSQIIKYKHRLDMTFHCCFLCMNVKDTAGQEKIVPSVHSQILPLFPYLIIILSEPRVVRLELFWSSSFFCANCRLFNTSQCFQSYPICAWHASPSFFGLVACWTLIAKWQIMWGACCSLHAADLTYKGSHPQWSSS
jgi:hypothetical protein